MCQKLPSQLGSKISFYSECIRFLKIGKYPLPLIGHIDETLVFFDMMPEKSLVQKGQKSVTIRASGSEKRHVTVVLTVAADGFILPPMIIFWGKSNQTIKEIETLEGYCYTRKSMDEWVLDVYLVWSSMEMICRKNKRNWISTDS